MASGCRTDSSGTGMARQAGTIKVLSDGIDGLGLDTDPGFALHLLTKHLLEAFPATLPVHLLQVLHR